MLAKRARNDEPSLDAIANDPTGWSDFGQAFVASDLEASGRPSTAEVRTVHSRPSSRSPCDGLGRKSAEGGDRGRCDPAADGIADISSTRAAVAVRATGYVLGTMSALERASNRHPFLVSTQVRISGVPTASNSASFPLPALIFPAARRSRSSPRRHRPLWRALGAPSGSGCRRCADCPGDCSGQGACHGRWAV